MKPTPWEKLSQADKLEIVEYIFKQLTIQPPGTFRKVIYDRLGFKDVPMAYVVLYEAGGMSITNAISEYYDNERRTDEAN